MDLQQLKTRFADSYWLLTLSILVLGPAALPLIWISQRLSKPKKWILTLVVLLVTAFSIWVTYQTGSQVFSLFKEFQALQN